MTGGLNRTLAFFGLGSGEPGHPDSDYEESEVDELAQVTPINSAYVVEDVDYQGDLRRIVTVCPRSYNDARQVGEAFRAGIPVIMNLTDMSNDDAKRLVDFAAGLIFGLNGDIERVTSKVFLLSPEHVQIATEGTGPQGPGGLYNAQG